MSANYVIETHRLGKDYGNKTAVADLSITVKRGEVFGFLGPNGAGKTTSVKMLLGLVSPSRGEGRMLGRRLGEPSARRETGFLPEHFRFHGWLSGSEFLQLHGDLHGVTRRRLAPRIPELLELVGLEDAGDKKLRAYSKGMLQRIGLAQALLNEPDLIILDEPTSGLDPLGRRLVRDIIADLRSLGKTVFINSHLLSEIEVTCDRVAFIKQGSIVRTVDLRGAEEEVSTVIIRARPVNAEILAALAQWSSDARVDGDRILLTLNKHGDVAEINRFLVNAGVDVYGLHQERTSLEDLFIQIMGIGSLS